MGRVYESAVLGDRGRVRCFRGLGRDTCVVGDTWEARHTLHRLARENYAIIYMTEALAGPLAADIDRYKSETTPAVILIPGKGGSLGLGSRALQAAVERAVGADIS